MIKRFLPAGLMLFSFSGFAQSATNATCACFAFVTVRGMEVQLGPLAFAPLVNGTAVSSDYNLRRMHPLLHRFLRHQGVDLVAPAGTCIYASADGVIEDAAYHGASGNLVRINHGDGIVTMYSHAKDFAPVFASGAGR
jgi:murein DD-endopeptidase MepM/ murein hydrolase activator NlpD